MATTSLSLYATRAAASLPSMVMVLRLGSAIVFMLLAYRLTNLPAGRGGHFWRQPAHTEIPSQTARGCAQALCCLKMLGSRQICPHWDQTQKSRELTMTSRLD